MRELAGYDRLAGNGDIVLIDANREFDLKYELRELVAGVVKAASVHGLTCKLLHSDERGFRRYRRRLLIEGYKCQIVSSRVHCVDGVSSRHTMYPASLPRTGWGDFLIYAIKDGNEPENVSYFVVPRGDTVKSTSVCAPENWLFKYKDAWSLLSETLPEERLNRRTQTFNWKLSYVMSRGKSLGLETALVKKVGLNRHVQNRILINGRKCQLMALARLSKDSSSDGWNYITLHAAKQTWADFLIFMLKTAGAEDVDIFVVPRERIPKTTTTSLTARWLNRYRDNWTFQNIVKDAGDNVPVHLKTAPRLKRPPRITRKIVRERYEEGRGSNSRPLEATHGESAPVEPPEPPEPPVDVAALIEEQVANIRRFYAKK